MASGKWRDSDAEDERLAEDEEDARRGEAEEEEEEDDDDEDDEDDEDGDGEDEGEGPGIGRKILTGRGVTLTKLLAEGLLKPGESAMSIDYLGKEFSGDLLANGKIRCHETKGIFNSPSAWAKYCKKLINPDKKSGCGWASVKYRGRNLTSFKSAWLKEKKYVEDGEGADRQRGSTVHVHKSDKRPAGSRAGGPQGPRSRTGEAETSLRDQNSSVECTPFAALGKIQPFTVTVTTDCLFLVNYHCHLTSSEVVGYLGGYWDVDSHNLSLRQAFPCKCRLGDGERAMAVENQIKESMERKGLALAGWYHSHPAASARPTLRDVDCQMDYQIKMKGSNDSSYMPCVGVICAPYGDDRGQPDSDLTTYWVMPPPENRPTECGKPMLMVCSVLRDRVLRRDVVDEMKSLGDYYKGAPDAIPFGQTWREDRSYYDQMKKSLTAHAAEDQTEDSVHQLLQHLLLL